VLSLASAGDKQVQLSLGWRTGIQFGLKKHGIICKEDRRKNLRRSR
jgi:hypothetical protein